MTCYSTWNLCKFHVEYACVLRQTSLQTNVLIGNVHKVLVLSEVNQQKFPFLGGQGGDGNGVDDNDKDSKI